MIEKTSRYIAISLWLCLLALLLSGLSLYQHTEIKYGLQTGKSFCNISASINCDAVNASPWAELLGVPIAAWGTIFYLSLFAILLIGIWLPTLIAERALLQLLALSSVAAILFSIYLAAISKFVIGSVCVVCVGLYVTNIALFLVALKANRPRAILSTALGAVGAAVRAFTGNIPESKAALRVGVLVVVLCIFCGLSLSDFMLVRFILPSREADQASEVAKAVLSEWHAAQRQNLDISAGNALAKDYRRGSEQAPVQIVEFSDFECSACRRIYTGVESLLKSYSGEEVSFVFKNFPLDQSCNRYMSRALHPSACYAASFARCAGEQDKFWEAADFLFTTSILEERGDTSGVRQKLLAGSGSLGLDGEALKECLDSGRYAQKIRSDIEQGQQLGVEGTPAFWVNGRRLKAASPEILKAVIEEALKAR